MSTGIDDGNTIEVVIKGDAQKIAALVLAMQGRQGAIENPIAIIEKAIRKVVQRATDDTAGAKQH